MYSENLDKENATGKNFDGRHPNEDGRYLTATSVLKDKVVNTRGEDLGKIHDIMLDTVLGRIEYVIIEFGGFLGIGEKLFAVPYTALRLDPEHKRYVLDKEKDFLEKAPGFNQAHWPMTNKHYEDVNNYWGNFMGPNVGGM